MECIHSPSILSSKRNWIQNNIHPMIPFIKVQNSPKEKVDKHLFLHTCYGMYCIREPDIIYLIAYSECTRPSSCFKMAAPTHNTICKV